MIKDIYEEILQYNCYLLLQGPKGFFFYRLAKFLQSLGKKVYKINFNGGDLMTFPFFNISINYRGKLQDFEDFLRNVIVSKKIDTLMFFGDYKPYHKIAIKVCEESNIPYYVFENGYLRPHYITLERGGINGRSKLPKDSSFYLTLPDFIMPEPINSEFSYIKRVCSSIYHYLFLELLRPYFPNYVPYKNYAPYASFLYCYFRGLVRKLIYKITERKTSSLIKNELRNKYFLVPLQVYNDSQIHLHSDFKNVEEFIYEVIKSFSMYAEPEHYLIFKHHPEDRGFTNYKRYIKKIALNFKVINRVLYVHDLHLPTLIRNSRGVVTINSTVGLQSLIHGVPVKVLGRAIYDITGLTFQGSLDEFWKNPGSIDNQLLQKFKNYLILRTQLNGSFYGRFPFDKEILSNRSFITLSEASSGVRRSVSSIRSGLSGSS